MMSEKIKDNVIVVLIGTGSFILGHLVTFYTFRAASILPVISALAFSAITFFLGVCPVMLYLGRTLRSLVVAALITAIYTTSLLLGAKLTPILIVSWFEYMGLGGYWERTILGIFHVCTLDIFTYGPWAVFFGILVFVLTDIKKRNILLLSGLFFLLYIVARDVAYALGFGVATIEYEIFGHGIFGIFFSLVVKHFFYPCSWSLFGRREYFHQETKNDRT